MPATLPTPVLSGTMLASEVLADLAEFRSWLNGGVVKADLAANSIGRRHLYAPDSFGWPMEGVRGVTGGSYQTDNTRDSIIQAFQTHQFWIFPESAREADGISPIATLAKRVWLPPGKVVVRADVWFDNINFSSGTRTPGSIALFERNPTVGAGTISQILGTERELTTAAETSGNYASADWLDEEYAHYHTLGVIEVGTARVYDVFLGYLSGAAVDPDHCIFSRGALTLTHHRQ